MSNYVIFNKEDKIKLDLDFISDLKKRAQDNDSKKITFCLHKCHEDKVHEMINVYPKDLYIRPHKHPSKTETKHVIEGKMLMIMYDDNGEVNEKFVLSEKNLGKCFTYRIEKNYYHSIIPITDVVVFHEIINGPYLGINDSIFPEWAPDNNDIKGIKEFISKVVAGGI